MTTSRKLVIREGRYYARADGSVHGPMRTGYNMPGFPWEDQNGRSYRDDGRWLASWKCEADLIRKVPATNSVVARSLEIAKEIAKELVDKQKAQPKPKPKVIVRWCFAYDNGSFLVLETKSSKRKAASAGYRLKRTGCVCGPIERHEFEAPSEKRGKR